MKILVDTNLLVRSAQRTHPVSRIARDALRQLYEHDHLLFVTPQNISEFWNVCTRPNSANGLGSSILATDRLASRIERLFTVLPESMQAFSQWRRLVVAHSIKGAKVHDARLAAIIISYRLDAILTFNGADFTKFSISVLDPHQIRSTV